MAEAGFREPVLPPPPERPRVTLFITSYNQEDYIRAAIEGAFAQTYSPLEIVMSDDASADRTFAIMEEMAAAYDGPHTLKLNRNQRNLGIMPHVEKVMALASGELIVENAGDDVSVPHRVARMVEVWLASGRRAKAIHSARRRMDEQGNLHEVIDDERVLANMTPLEVIRDHGTMVGASLAWSREVYDVFGPQSPIAIFDDFPTCFRASLIGEIHYIPEPLLHYRMGGTSSRPTEEFGYNYLYGFRIKDHRWHRSFWRRYLADMEIVRPPDYEECRRLCEEKIANADFHIGLAETPWWKLPAALPRNLMRSLRERDPLYVRETGKYLLGPAYMRWHDLSRRRWQRRREQAETQA
jgi:glycosyltransferase involved in cell wall biosynthesis